MIHKHRNGIHWLEFELLADFPIIHGCLMRHGGCSSQPLNSLNLGKNVGDKIENVDNNRLKVMQALGLEQMIPAKIGNGANLFAISPLDQEEMPVCDGVMTNFPGLGLIITQADCQGAIFYDPIHHAMANVHCGWRGSVMNIYEKTVAYMQSKYGSKPAEMLVCISPSLGPENAEFVNYRQELPEDFWSYQIRPHYFDFWAISESQLKKAGILSHHIQCARIDTYANAEDFFSHRRSKLSGRQATVCALLEPLDSSEKFR